jgi:stress-induced morphogen
MSVVFDFQQEAQQVERVLRDAFGPNAAIRTEEGWHGRVHAKIVSSDFDGKSEDQKQEMIWSVLRERLGDNAQAVSLVLAYGLDEV